LTEDVRNRTANYHQFSELTETQHIVKLIQRFMKDFGHHSESGNDISHPKWEEDLEFVFKMVIDSVDIKNNSQQIHFEDLKIPFLKKRKYRKSYRKAGRFALYREQISSLYIYGYGLFRILYLKLADDFVVKGILIERDDIFYLQKDEVQEILQEKVARSANWRKIIEKRKSEYEETKNVILPSVIYGDEAPVIEQGSIKNFNGVATSSGTYKGKTKVVNHISDFDKIVEGDVVLIPFSDVSWTPALVKAGAIVSESGGMLSHCSIIAREMGIPALVSVDNACSLDDNLLVTVNGSNGILTIHDYE
jgi:phosphoenolpyruvate synthase/pyruvate phosphate dikinase